MLIFDPDNTEGPANEIYAFFSKDKKGNEAIMAFGVNGTIFPLVTSSKQMLKIMEQKAESIIRDTKSKKTVVLKKFKLDEEIEIKI